MVPHECMRGAKGRRCSGSVIGTFGRGLVGAAEIIAQIGRVRFEGEIYFGRQIYFQTGFAREKSWTRSRTMRYMGREVHYWGVWGDG